MPASVWKEGSQTVYVLQCNKTLCAGRSQDRTSLRCNVPVCDFIRRADVLYSSQLWYVLRLDGRYRTAGSERSGTETQICIVALFFPLQGIHAVLFIDKNLSHISLFVM